jgi:hypothetical protein
MATLTKEINVAISPEIETALKSATAFSGIRASQYIRIALVEKLAREQFMRHPGLVHLEKTNGQQINPAA